MRADLHIHTSASDGLKTPREAAEHMHGLGVELISVTDHDTVSGLDEAAEECRALGVHFVPGIEISAHSNSEIHILGYNIDYKNPDFCEQIAKVKDMRRARNLLIGEKLAGYGVELGIDFSSDGLGRMNIARLMVEKGYAKDVQDAFNRYLGPNGKAYSDVRRTSPLEAVKLIAAFGGVPVLAHPKKYLQQKTLRLLVEGLKPFGLKGSAFRRRRPLRAHPHRRQRLPRRRGQTPRLPPLLRHPQSPRLLLSAGLTITAHHAATVSKSDIREVAQQHNDVRRLSAELLSAGLTVAVRHARQLLFVETVRDFRLIVWECEGG